METVVSALQRAVEELLGRSSGPFHARLLLQPLMASLLAIRSGLQDAREGRPPFLWTFLTDPAERERLLHSAWKDVGKIFVIAIVLDVIYQIMALHAFRFLQTVIVAVVLAILPYILIRGVVARFARKSKSPAS